MGHAQCLEPVAVYSLTTRTRTCLLTCSRHPQTRSSSNPDPDPNPNPNPNPNLQPASTEALEQWPHLTLHRRRQPRRHLVGLGLGYFFKTLQIHITIKRAWDMEPGVHVKPPTLIAANVDAFYSATCREGKTRGGMHCSTPKAPAPIRRATTTIPAPMLGGTCAKWKQELRKGELSIATLPFCTRRLPHSFAILEQRTVGQRNDPNIEFTGYSFPSHCCEPPSESCN